MAGKNGPSVEELRTKAQAVLDKAKSDPDFVAHLKGDPEGTLKEEGIPDTAATKVGGELAMALRGEEADVEGYRGCDWTCDRYTCIITICGYVPYTG